jgi:ribonuclease T1
VLSGPADRNSERSSRRWALRLRQAAQIAWTGMVVGLATAGTGALGKDSPSAAAPTVALAELPQPAQQTFQRVLSGGPFPYQKDGTVFGNRERLLPSQARGYYREYTVQTPGLSHRGARRIVCGGPQPRVPDTCYYTADHYASFSRIVP